MATQLLQPQESAVVTSDIRTVSQIDAQSFRAEHIDLNRPVKMTGMMDEWPAMQKWSFEYFRELGSQATVHLEEGNVMQTETEFRKETFADYISQLIEGDKASGRKAYLSVFRIFDQFPQLQADVDFELIDQHKVKSSTVGWIGPAGTVTGYHIDWGDNILAQVSGRKSIHLAAPADTRNMYVSKKFDQGTTMSQVDFDPTAELSHDHDRFPLFGNVKHHRVILNPGEMLFIPRGWWHHVQSLDKSISVSNLGYDLKGVAFDAVPHRIKQMLHNVGLWNCDCTCHVYRDGKRVPK